MTNEISTYEHQALDFLQSTNTTFKCEFVEFGKHFSDDEESRNIFKCTLQNDKHKYSFRFGSSIKDSCKEVTQPKILRDGETTVFYGFRHTGTLNKEVSFGVSLKTTYEVLRGIKSGNIDPETLIQTDELKIQYDQYIADVKAFNLKVSKRGWSRNERIENPATINAIESKTRKAIDNRIKQLSEETETILAGQADEILPPTAYDVLACITKYPVYDFADFCSEFGYDEDSRKAYKTYKAVKREWENVAILFNDEELEFLREIQ